MAVNKVGIYVSQVLEDLNNGYTWLKKDDLGYGSIQEKYNAKDEQIAIIRKHPALKNAETTVTIFTVIDDTKEDYNRETTTTFVKEQENVEPSIPSELSPVDDFNDVTTENVNTESSEEEFSAFANL